MSPAFLLSASLEPFQKGLCLYTTETTQFKIINGLKMLNPTFHFSSLPHLTYQHHLTQVKKNSEMLSQLLRHYSPLGFLILLDCSFSVSTHQSTQGSVNGSPLSLFLNLVSQLRLTFNIILSFLPFLMFSYSFIWLHQNVASTQQGFLVCFCFLVFCLC